MIRSSLVLKFISALVLFSTSGFAQVSDIWYAESSRPVKQTIPVFQGETHILAPVMQAYGSTITNLSSAVLYWQTNGMDAAWWSKPASVTDGQISAIFHPTNDVGAAAYTFFIGSSAGAGTSYRAYGTLKMQSSPGFNPSTAIEPGYYPTLATEITPYVLALIPSYDQPGSAATVSNALTAAIASSVAPLASTASVAAVASSIAAVQAYASTNRTDKMWSSPTTYTDAAGVQWEIGSATLNAYKCVQDSGSVHLGDILNDIYYPYEITVGTITGLPMITVSNILYTGVNTAYDLQHSFYSENAPDYGFPLTAWTFRGITGDVWEMGELYFDDPYNHTVNEFDPYVYTFKTTNQVAVYATEDYVDTEIAKIPLPPSNVSSGWLLWDAGSNVYWVVTVSNLSFTISEAL